VYSINSLNTVKKKLFDFSAEVSREDKILKEIFRNENLYEINNHNGVRIVNFAT
jgi:hypothetical protein